MPSAPPRRVLVVGLTSGADDYVTKPFGVRELIALSVRTAQLALDRERRHAVVRDTPVELTKQEFDLVRVEAAGAGSRTRASWGPSLPRPRSPPARA